MGPFFWSIMMAWTILVEGTKETVMLNYTDIGPVVSDKKILKVFCIDI